MQNNKEVLEAVFLLINKKKNKQAKLLMDGISEEQFINALSADNKNYTDEMHDFVMIFNKIKWSKYITMIPSARIHDFLTYAKLKNIDLLTPNYYEKKETLLDTLIRNVNSGSTDSNLELFLVNVTNNFINKENKNLSVIFKSLLDPEDKNNPVRKMLLNLNLTSKSLFVFKKLLTEEEFNILDSTRKIRSFFSRVENNSSTEDLNKLIDDGAFNAQINLLSDDWIRSIQAGNINSVVDSEKYKVFKKLLVNNFFDIDFLNKPLENYFTVFERLIINNLEQNYSGPSIEQVKRLMEELDFLEKLGVEPKVTMHNKEHLEKMFKKVEDNIANPKKNRRSDIDKDVMELSYDLNLPPHITQRFIDFMDKRYGLKKDIVSEDKKEDLEKISNGFKDLLNKIIFINQPKEDLKKPKI